MTPSRAHDNSTARARERWVVALKLAGLTFTEIAEQVGYADRAGAHKAFLRGLDREHPVEQAEQMRVLELARLDRLQRAVWPAAMRGDVRAVQSALRIGERRARLLGLDAPVKVEVTDEVDAAIRDLAAALAAE